MSATLKKELGWIPISAGDCLREEKERSNSRPLATRSGSKDAELINDYIKKGLIVPGEITINLLLKKIRVELLDRCERVVLRAAGQQEDHHRWLPQKHGESGGMEQARRRQGECDCYGRT